MQVFKLKKGDTLPVLSVLLQYSNGSPVDLTSSTVYFHMGQLSNYAPYFSGLCVVTDQTNGAVEYRWVGSSDTGSIGNYWGEFKANWTGSSMTLPNDHSLQIQIAEDYE
jgi:hypothetical protein